MSWLKQAVVLSFGMFFLSSLACAEKIQVTASFSILGDITAQIGGDRVEVTSIIGPDQDAHVYQIKPSDIKKIQASSLVVVNGLGFEGAGFSRGVAQAKTPVAVASHGIFALPAQGGGHEHEEHGHEGHDHENEEEHGHEENEHEGHNHGMLDPHAFTNPALVTVYARNITNALISIDPAGQAYYRNRLNQYLSELNNLDQWAKQTIAAIAKERRKVLTAHNAFTYLGKQYDIVFMAPQGVSTEAEASAKTVAAIINQAKAHNINAIFAENIKDARLINQISKEAGIQVIGKLYADALSAPDGEAGNYIQMMRFNIEQLSQAMKQS